MIEFTADTIARLMQQHRSEILRMLAYRVSCPEAAQDIFQETFIRYTGYQEKIRSITRARLFSVLRPIWLPIIGLRCAIRRYSIASNNDSCKNGSRKIRQTVWPYKNHKRFGKKWEHSTRRK